MPDAAAAGAIAPVQFEFVIGNRPDQLKGGSSTRVRSYLSRRAWQAHLPTRPAPPSSSSSSPADAERGSREGHAAARPRPPRRRRGKPYSVTFEYVAGDEPGEGGPGETGQRRQHQQHDKAWEDEEVEEVPRQWDAHQGQMVRRPSPNMSSSLAIEYRLGGGRVDPFRSNPGPWRSYIPALTDHCTSVALTPEFPLTLRCGAM